MTVRGGGNQLVPHVLDINEIPFNYVIHCLLTHEVYVRYMFRNIYLPWNPLYIGLSAWSRYKGIYLQKNFFAGDTMTFFSDNPALENLFYIYEHELFYQLKKAGIK